MVHVSRIQMTSKLKSRTDMNMYAKAAAQLRKVGIEASASTNNNGSSVLMNVGNGRYFDVELSLREVKKWADLYDEECAEELKESDPYEILEEIARIFHNLGWNLGENGSQDTTYIKMSERYLENVYKAFNPVGKK